VIQTFDIAWIAASDISEYVVGFSSNLDPANARKSIISAQETWLRDAFEKSLKSEEHFILITEYIANNKTPANPTYDGILQKVRFVLAHSAALNCLKFLATVVDNGGVVSKNTETYAPREFTEITILEKSLKQTCAIHWPKFQEYISQTLGTPSIYKDDFPVVENFGFLLNL
jgi:hypothetical protein